MEAYVELAPPDCRRPWIGGAFRTTLTGTEYVERAAKHRLAAGGGRSDAVPPRRKPRGGQAKCGPSGLEAHHCRRPTHAILRSFSGIGLPSSRR